MPNHRCPIEIATYGADCAAKGIELAGAEISIADMASCRQIAADYLEALQQGERDLPPEQIKKAVDSGHARLTRELR